jgi:hypothetical protein
MRLCNSSLVCRLRSDRRSSTCSLLYIKASAFSQSISCPISLISVPRLSARISGGSALCRLTTMTTSRTAARSTNGSPRTRPGASPPTSPSCRSGCANPEIFGQSEQGFGTPRSGRQNVRENWDQRSSGPSKASPLTTASSPKRARTRSTACSASTARSSTKSLGSA